MPFTLTRPPEEVSAGAVLFRPIKLGYEFCLICVKGAWSLPKGHIEKGESIEAAALREVSEETGIPTQALKIHSALPTVDYLFRRDGHLVGKRVHNLLVAVQGTVALQPQAGEIDDVAWFNADAAIRQVKYSNVKRTLRAARNTLNNSGLSATDL